MKAEASKPYVSAYELRANAAQSAKAELWRVIDKIYPASNWPKRKRSARNPVLPPPDMFGDHR